MNDNFLYLLDLFAAIGSIDDEYCNWDYNDTIQKTDRVFAYELYHQLKLISNIKTTDYEGIKFNGEIGKKIRNDINSLGTNFLVDQKNFNPDLVLHKDQIDSSSENQKLIVEIKSNNETDEKIAEDIIKLNYAIEHLNFQFGVFISVNTNFETIVKKMKRIFIAEHIPHLHISNLKYIYIVNYRQRKIDHNTLYNIIYHL